MWRYILIQYTISEDLYEKVGDHMILRKITIFREFYKNDYVNINNETGE